MSDTKDLSLPLASQKSTLPKKKSNINNINREPKKDMIIHFLRQKKKIVGNILSRAGKVSKTKSRKYKNCYNVLNNQGYTFEEWEKLSKIMMMKNFSTQKAAITKTVTSLNILTVPKKTLSTSTTSEAHQKQKPT